MIYANINLYGGMRKCLEPSDVGGSHIIQASGSRNQMSQLFFSFSKKFSKYSYKKYWSARFSFKLKLM